VSDALDTDLYQLTMLQGYFERGMNQTAVFELFVRRLPRTRNFLIAAGLEQALDYLERLRFSDEDLAWLRSSDRFPRKFLERLAGLRFTGDVDAMPEGTLCFADEPLIRVTAPLSEAQLVETRLINLIHFQTLIASKAARAVLAAPGKQLIDFGLRRAHGAEAGLHAARAAWLAGFAGTSNVLAGARFRIPLYGTMAHSYVESHDREADAFLSYARARPDDAMLLIDTYDTEAAAHEAVAVAARLARDGINVRGVRIDSGDLAAHARAVRAILDAGGFADVRIFASGGLDELSLRALVDGRAPIDGFGVGSSLVTSSDAPVLDCAYKLVEYAGRPRFKRSEGKRSWPGAKQVYRSRDGTGHISSDLIALAGERIANGAPLLEPVMRRGRRVHADSLTAARARATVELEALPRPLRELTSAAEVPVARSPGLLALAREVTGSS
jgi:nicotinate phosphoribosyltransferase